MSISKDISLRVIASLADYRRELEKMPDITAKEAKKASLAMQKELTKAEVASAMAATRAATKATAGALDEMGDAAKRNASHLKLVEDGAGKTESITKALGGALGMLSPELQAVANVGGEAAGGLEAVLKSGAGLAGPLGLLTAAVAAGAAAWRYYSDELKEAEEWTKKQADAAADAQKAHDAMKDMNLDIAVMYGDVTEAEAKMIRAREKAAAVTKPLIDIHQQEILQLQKANEKLRASEQVYNQNRRAIEANEEQIRLHSAAVGELEIKTEEGAHAMVRASESAHKQKKGLSEAEKEASKLAASMADLAARTAAEDNPFAGIDQEVASLARLRTEYELTVEQMALVDQRLAQLDQNRADIQGAALEDQRRALEKMDEEIRDRAAKAADEDKAAAAEKKARKQAQFEADMGGYSQIAGAVSTIAKLEADRDEASLKKRREMFALAKAAAIAEIAINTAVAIQKAFAQIGPIAGGAAAAGITASGAAQAAVVLSQKLPEAHMGEPASRRRFAPDEEVRVITKHEEVVTKREQREGSGSGGVVKVMLDGRVLDVLNTRSAKRTGQPARGAKRVGHRVRD